MAEELRAVDSAEAIVDELTRGRLDWRRLVSRYPLAALLVAGVGGYWLGRSRGSEVLGQLAGYATDQLVQHINGELGEEVL